MTTNRYARGFDKTTRWNIEDHMTATQAYDTASQTGQPNLPNKQTPVAIDVNFFLYIYKHAEHDHVHHTCSPKQLLPHPAEDFPKPVAAKT